MVDMTDFSVHSDTNSSPSTSSHTKVPVFNNCVFNSCKNFWTEK